MQLTEQKLTDARVYLWRLRDLSNKIYPTPFGSAVSAQEISGVVLLDVLPEVGSHHGEIRYVYASIAVDVGKWVPARCSWRCSERTGH